MGIEIFTDRKVFTEDYNVYKNIKKKVILTRDRGASFGGLEGQNNMKYRLVHQFGEPHRGDTPTQVGNIGHLGHLGTSRHCYNFPS